MGNDAQVLRKIRVGQLQGGAFTAGGLGERYPALNIYGIPFLFRSLDEVDAVRAKLDAKLIAGLEQAGFVSFGFTEGGFANLLSNEPIKQRRRHAAQEGLGAGRRPDQLPRDAGAWVCRRSCCRLRTC